MVRSETPTPPAGGHSTTDEVIAEVVCGVGQLLWFAARATVVVAWWSVLFPMISIPVAGAAYLGVTHGWLPGVIAAATGAATLGLWRLAGAKSFRRAVSGRMWKRWRRWLTYRRPWADVCALHGLANTLNDRVIVPRLRRARVGYLSDKLTVRMLTGQTLTDWQGQSDALGHTFGALSVHIRSDKPGWIRIDVHHTDTLSAPIPLPAPAGTVDLEHLPIGVTESGVPWSVRVLGRHVLVAGATGAGKGSIVWSIITAIAPAIRSGVAALWVVDPKGGIEFGRGSALYARFSYDTAEDTVALLRDAAAVLTDRANRLRGITRQHTPTPAEPLIVIVIDELAALIAYLTDRKIKAEIEQLLGLILSQGRAVGVSVIACVQDPSKEVLALRQLFPTRIGLRLSEATQVAMILGNGARERGALCELIPDSLPGTGYVAEDGTAHPIRVRAFHVTDTDIDALAQHYAPNNKTVDQDPATIEDSRDDWDSHPPDPRRRPDAA